MTNLQIATLLRNVAASYTVKNEKKYRFQIIAYQNAAEALENSTSEASDLYKEGKLDTLPGIGKSICSHLEELFRTNTVKHFEWIMKGVPQSMFPLLDIPGFGPKKAYRLVSYFHLTDPASVISDLEQRARRGKIAEIEGFGEKSETDILKAIEEYKKRLKKNVRMPLPFAYSLAEKLLTYLGEHKDVEKAYPLGSLRRMAATIGDIDIAIVTQNPKSVLEHFVSYPYKDRILEKGKHSASILLSGGKHVDLMVQEPAGFGALLQHFTGSQGHNIRLREYALKKGLSLSEYGIKKEINGSKTLQKFDTEEKFYKALGLVWIPPELREDKGEIDLAAKNNLPHLVELKDIKGDFHIHSNFSIEPSHDLGKDSMVDMVKKAKNLGYSYLGFSEHNPSVSKHTDEQIYQILQKRRSVIEQLKSDNKDIRVFSLLEVDILSTGSLAVDDKSLALLDAVIVSIHSGFETDKKQMTERVLKGLSHPKAKILAHPTGRLINARKGYDLLWDEVFAFCRQHNKALEINSWPERLDLPDLLVYEAVKNKVKLVISTDSHGLPHMDLMRYGVAVARRGFASKDDIINTMEYNKVAKFFAI